jgi:hypothetical protein
MFNVHPHRLAGIVLLLVVFRPLLLAQPECPMSSALISARDPIYADATELAHRLERQTFVIRCIFPTKLGSIFQVADGEVLRSTIAGEANFITNYGSFDIIFLPKPQTFANFKITERREGSGYRYRFTGTPKVWAGDQFKFGTSYRNYFLKSENHLLLTGDEKLRARLREALPGAR